MKRLLSITLVFSILFGLIVNFIPQTAEAALGDNASVVPVLDFNGAGEARYYAVAFMYYESWSRNDGTWNDSDPDRPGETVTVTHPYTFSFPGRKVRNVRPLKFLPSSHLDLFNRSRAGANGDNPKEQYTDFSRYVSSNIYNPSQSDETGEGTSTISFTASTKVLLSSIEPYDMNAFFPGSYCPTCMPSTKIYRYYVPILLEFQLDGVLEVHHKTTTGENIDAAFTNQTQNMAQGTPQTITPGTAAGYTYVGYKKSTVSSPSGGSIVNGNPPTFVYDGKYDKYYLNLYYEKDSDGKAYIRHVTKTGQSLDSVFGDHTEPLVHGEPYAPIAPKNDDYKFLGYVKTSGSPGTPPAYFMNPISGEYSISSFNRTQFSTLYLYYVYDVTTAGKIHVRHMVRSGPTGTYKQQGSDQVIPVATLPHTRTLTADADAYGTIQGKSLSYSAYSSTVSTGSNVSVSLTSTASQAYVTFFYENAASFSGDFDVLPPKIAYKDSFKLHPKDFVLNGCTYVSHTWKIERDGLSWQSSPQSNQSLDMNFSYSSYPALLGVGIQNVYLKIKTNCGESKWIGPKTLELTGPKNNRPPSFQIGFVRPSNPKEILHTVPEGEVLSLVVIEDPTVPTPTDPDGDTITFNGFDFASGDDWVKSIPSKGIDHYLQYVSIEMDGPGYHTVTASMRDAFGALATAFTSIEIVPPNPVPVIDGLDRVVQGRPLTETFKGDRSYSPIGRSINHARDEWTNVKAVYNTVGTEDITLNVYDSMGLKSLRPAVHQLTVLEDLPPIPVLEYPNPSVRNASVVFANTSYSPDGDAIIKNKVTYRYDKDNDGNFIEESAAAITMNGQNEFTFTPVRVGQYRFYVELEEDWGKKATGEFDFQVINDAPSVNFDISTESKTPAPLVPVQLKGNILAGLASGWKNSDFKTASKASSWNYNSANGALVHSPTDFSRFSLNVAPAANIKIIDTGMYYYTNDSYSYLTGLTYNLGNGYFARIEQRSPSTTLLARVYKIDASGSIVQVSEHEDVSGIYGVDVINQLVYAKTNASHEGASIPAIATYTMASFLSSSGIPQNTGFQAVINGIRMDLSFQGLNEGTKYRPTAFGDALYYEEYVSLYTNTYRKKLFNWGEDTAYSMTEYGDSDYYYDSLPFSNRGFADNKMRYHFYVDTGSSGSHGYKIFNPADDSNANIENYSDMWSEIHYNYTEDLIPTFDGKYVISNYTGTGIVYDTTTKKRLYSADTYILGTTASGLVYGTGNGYVKGYKIDSGGALTQLWNSPSTAAYSSILQDNSDGLVVMEVQESTVTVSRVDLFTGAKTNLATLVKPSDITDCSISLAFTGELKVDMSNGRNQRKTFFITSTGNRFANEALSSQNQLLGTPHFKNVMLQYKMKMNLSVNEDIFSGFSFGAQDISNMYRVEHNAKKLQLVKVEGGHRTVIQSMPYTFNTHQTYQVKIVALDGRVKVYVDGVPLIDKADPTFGDGQFGPFSEIPRTEFTGMSYSDLKDMSAASKLQGVALVGQDMLYTITNDDAENDPMIEALTEWKYTKTKEKFLNAGDGKSGSSVHNGKIYQAPLNQPDKVGVYEVSYKTVDDPNADFRYPSTAFQLYRKSSNTALQTLIVHRAPIVDYDLGLNGDKTVKWTDRSRDPDRYLSSTNYSTEATGIDYLKTKGILQKKFYYISPSGTFVESKLVTPTELGTFTVGMAVKDEYGAWTDFLEKTITIGTLPSPDEPPHAGFTSPATGYRGVPVTMDSTAWDKEDGARQNLPHEYYIQTDGGAESLASTARTSWTKTFSTLGTFSIRQTVEDHVGQASTVTHSITITNRVPAAELYLPSSTNQSAPEKLATATPTFKWNYSDLDDDSQTKYQVKVYRYGGILEQDSGIRSGSALLWTPGAALPEKVDMYVIVRVFDGYDWSSYSAPKYFYLETNQPPAADFDWLPKPVYEGDKVSLTQTLSDSDQDSLSIRYQVTDPVGASQAYDLTGSFPYATAGPSFNAATPGSYTVQLTVSDGKAAPVFIRKTINVLPLTVSGQVKHTEQWNERRKESNLAASGNENSPRSYATFWAGERFMLEAATTVTGTATAADRVTATLNGVAVSLQPANAAKTAWRGDMWEESFENLPEGPLLFTFKAVYTNGTVKSTTVTVTIAGNTRQTVGVHRVQ
ncbi:glycoside hydrolase family 78 protein [Paenibacillus silvisoli]|uniref:glycoside hydrolase family 78 protein n=1 Tax=Paenibacillus silvisoli TaxID=3110539 RepID=UPI0028054492|nr:hypothetical protein [Paenibacillus silvisoli]